VADAYTKVKYRDRIDIESGTFVPDTGTETIVGCTATLFDASGAVVAAMDEVPVTSFTPGPQTAPYAIEGFSPVGLGLHEPTFQTGQDVYSLDFEAVDDRTPPGHYVSTQCIIVKPRGS